jgi:hypothetical protein
VPTQRGKRPTPGSRNQKAARPAAKPAAKAAPRPAAPAPAKPAAAAPRRGTAALAPPPRAARAVVVAPGDRAAQIRADVQRSKLTHPEPWGYTSKARGWDERAARLATDIAAGRDVTRALEALAGEIEGDRDFQAARRLF